MDRSRIRPVLIRGVAWGAAALVVLLLAVLLILRATPAGTALVNRTLSTAMPREVGKLAAREVRGNWITRWEVIDLRLTRGDSILAAADTVGIRAHPWSLLAGRIDVGRVDVAGLFLSRALSGSSPAAGDSAATDRGRAPRAPAYHGPAVRVGRVVVRDGRYGGTDGLALTRISLDARDLRLSDEVAVTLDHLALRCTPAAPDTAATDLWLSGTLSQAGVDVDSLRLSGPHSDVSGRATLAFRARDAAGEMSVDLHARPLDLSDLEMIPGVPGMEGRIAADLSLRGADIEHVGGTARVQWDRADFGAARLGATRIDAVVADSRAEVDARTSYEGMRAGIRGWIRPLEAAPDYDFEVELAGLPHAATRATPPDSARANLHVSGRGFGPDEVSVDGTVVDAASRIELAGHFAAAPDPAAEPAWRLDRLAFDRVNLAAWLDGAPATDLNGVLTARGYGVDTEALRATADWHFGESRVGGTQIASASGRAALDGLHAGTSARVKTEAGEVAIDTVTVTLDRTNGFAAAGALVLARATVRGRVVERGRVDYRYRRGTLNASTTFVTDAGTARAKITLAPSAERYGLVVDDGRFVDVDARAWSPGLPPTRLSGSFSARMTVGGEAAPTGSATVHLDSSLVAARTQLQGEVSARVDGGHIEATGGVDVGDDRVTLGADVRLEHGKPRGWARGVVPFSLLAALADRDTLSTRGALRVEARFAAPDTQAARVNVRVAGAGRFGQCAVDSVLASLRIDDGVAVVDTLRVRSDAAEVDGAGRLGRPGSTGAEASHFDATVKVDNPAALFALVGGGEPSALERSLLRAEGASARVTLRGDSLGADLDARLDAQHHAAVSVVALRDTSSIRLSVKDANMQAGRTRWGLVHPALLRLAPDRLEVDSLEVAEVRQPNGTKTKRTTPGRVYVHGVIDRRGEQDFQVDADGVGLDIITGGLGWEAVEGRLDAHLSLRGPATAPRAEGSVRIAPIVAGTPTGETRADLDWNGRVVELRAAITSPQGDSLKVSGHYPMVLPLAASGDAPSPGPAAGAAMGLRIDARRFPLAAAQPLLPPRVATNVGGTLDADIRFVGEGTPVGSGRIAINDGAVDLPSLGVRYDGLQFDAVLDGDRLSLRRVTLKSDGGELSIAGDVRIAGATRVEPNLTVTARRFVFVDRPNLRYVASGDLTLGGALSAPVVRGRLSMGGCTYYLPPDVLGGIDSGPEIELTPADREMLEETFGYEVRKNREATREMFERADVDVQVSLARDNWLRKRISPRLALELTGDIHARKAPGGELELNGRVAPLPRRGYIEYFGRTFDFVGGEVLLNGRMEDHTVDARAEYKVRPPRGTDAPDVVVTLEVQGHFDDLSLSLTSQPSLTETEIISYITTGRSPVNTQTAPDNRGNDALALAADIGLSRMTSALEDAAQERIGLDVLQVRYDAILGATLMAGRYMTPRLYLGFQQPLQYRESSSTSTQHPYQTAVELEFELKRWLVVNLQGEVSLLRSYLRARHEY